MQDNTAGGEDDFAGALIRARDRESATRRILEVISASRGDEVPVFEAILQSACDLCETPFAGLYLVDEPRRHARLVSSLGARTAFIRRVAAEWALDGGAAIPRAIGAGAVVHIEDLADTELYRAGDPQRVEAVETEGMRSFLAVPLMQGGRSVGAIGLYRREVAPFTPEQVALVETFAAQAVIAIENVRQFRAVEERRRDAEEALAHQTATADVLGVISRSPGDLQPVFDTIVGTAARLCRATHALMFMRRDGAFHIAATNNAEADLVRYAASNPIVPDPGSIVGRVTASRGSVQIEDCVADPEYTLREYQRIGNFRTLVGVPLLRDGDVIGVISLFRREVEAFSPREIALVETFAAQAVIAVENVRQFRELETRLEREEATREILQAISRSRDDEGPVLETIVRSAARLCSASTAGLQLVNEARTHFRFVCKWGEDRGGFTPGEEWTLDSPLMVPTAIREGQVIHKADLADDPIYHTLRDPARVRLVEVEGIRSYLVVPLIRNGAAFGSITLSRHEVRPFSQDDIRLIETFAEHAAIAIENTRQFRDLQTRLAREQATREILEVISRSRADEAPVFDAILENARRLCDAPLAFMTLANEARTHVSVPAWVGARPDFAKVLQEYNRSIEETELVAIRPVATGEIVHLHDCSDDELYRQRHPQRVLLVEVEGIRTILAVPMISGGISLGAILLYRREIKPFDADQIDLVRAFASQAAIAIENARQFRALAARTEEVQALNTSLESRVAEQVGEIERMGRLKRFLSPQVADAIVSGSVGDVLSSHRALLGILFCDIRGFTAFCEIAEPEETIEVLRTYHEEMGRLIVEHGAGVDHRSGDGIMVLFNDPLPCDDPAGDALRLAIAMRVRMEELCARWKRLGHRLGFGVGVSLGYATVGMVGSEGRFDYTASGTAVNLASRLCDSAGDGEILLSQRAWIAVEDAHRAESAGELTLKGMHAPVEVFRYLGPRAVS